MYDILIRNTTVMPLTETGGVFEGYDIAVAGQLIAAMGPTGTFAADAVRTIEGADRFVMPGFVNTHTHMGQTFHRGTAEAMLLQEFWEICIQHQARVLGYPVRVGFSGRFYRLGSRVTRQDR